MFLFSISSAPVATGLLLGIAGALTPLITQIFKKNAKLTGRWPIIVTAGVSIVLAVIVIMVVFATGEATSWRDLITLTPWIFTEATLLYHLGMPVDLTGPPVELKQSDAQKTDTGL